MSAAVSTVAVSNKVPGEFKVPHNTLKTTLQECNSRNFIKFHFLQVAASDKAAAVSDKEVDLVREAASDRAVAVSDREAASDRAVASDKVAASVREAVSDKAEAVSDKVAAVSDKVAASVREVVLADKLSA